MQDLRPGVAPLRAQSVEIPADRDEVLLENLVIEMLVLRMTQHD